MKISLKSNIFTKDFLILGYSGCTNKKVEQKQTRHHQQSIPQEVMCPVEILLSTLLFDKVDNN